MGRYCHILLLSAFLPFFACTNNSPTTPDGSNELPPNIPNLAVLTISISQNAPADIQGMVVAANSLTGLGNAYLNALKDIQPTSENGKWTWTYNNGSLILTLIAASTSDSTVSWELILDGTETTTNTIFENWTAMTGASTIDGKAGNWAFYNLNTTQVAGNVYWLIDVQDNVTIVLITDTFRVDAKANLNGSGEIAIEQNSVKIYKANWTSAGGTWFSYDPNTGQQTNSGSWTN